MAHVSCFCLDGDSTMHHRYMLSMIRKWLPGNISMALCEKDETPLLSRWSYVFLALSHRIGPIQCTIDNKGHILYSTNIWYSLPKLHIYKNVYPQTKLDAYINGYMACMKFTQQKFRNIMQITHILPSAHTRQACHLPTQHVFCQCPSVDWGFG